MHSYNYLLNVWLSTQTVSATKGKDEVIFPLFLVILYSCHPAQFPALEQELNILLKVEQIWN